jgi:hypothetical protein
MLLLARPVSAALVRFTGTLSVDLNGSTVLTAPGSGVATVNQSAGGHPITHLGGHPITHLTIPAGAFGTALQPNPIVLSGGGCTRPDDRVVCRGTGLNGFGALSGFVTGTTISGLANLVVPLTAVGGSAATTAVGGAGWKTGRALAVREIYIIEIFTHSPASYIYYYYQSYSTFTTATGSRSTNPGSDFQTDRLALVTPISIFNDAEPDVGPRTVVFDSGFARIAIHFIPEPSNLVLLAVGIAGMAVYGRRRAKH